MNLEKLFQTQKVLRDRINYNGEDRFNKLVLALLVEIGECANEWRGFKFWSKNQKPRKEHSRLSEDLFGVPVVEYYNPLLEEYVDGLHFVLELGIELDIFNIEGVEAFKAKSGITQQFTALYKHISGLKMQLEASYKSGIGKYYHIFNMYIGLGEMLGFTWEQIEQAYYDKNQINHERQDNGY
jgi:dimeric dUTPase (all-alpha-NTP-PPase superfamily)